MAFGVQQSRQRGFRTGEKGDEYAKNTAFSVDGKLLKQEQIFGESALLSQNFDYYWDRFTKSRRIQLRDLNGRSAFAYELSQTRDALGRLAQLYLDQKLLLSFE